MTPIDPESVLNQEQSEVARRFGDLVRADPARAWATYCAIPESHGGRIVNVDLSRLLCPEYECRGGAVEVVRRARTLLTPATYRTAKAYSDALFAALLTNEPSEYPVVFSSGGPASGKTMALMRETESLVATTGGPSAFHPVIYDTSFADLSKALRDIALCGSHPVRIVFVECAFELAMISMLDRALHPGTNLGRYISAQRMARLHDGARRTILLLADACAHGPLSGRDVRIACYQRAQGSGEVHKVPLEQLRLRTYPTVEELSHVAIRTLDQRRNALPEDLYRAVRGTSDRAEE